MDYAALFKALNWEDQGDNQFALTISSAGVRTLINYYNTCSYTVKDEDGNSVDKSRPVHSLLKTNEGSIAEHNCTANSNSLKYFSFWGGTPATCTKPGVQTSWCASCGKIYEDV